MLRATTLPSSFYLGCLITFYYNETDTQCCVDQEMQKVKEKLIETLLTILNMVITTQTFLIRWKRVDNIPIPKKKSATLQKTSEVYIYEADW
jgi:hypothetical protein